MWKRLPDKNVSNEYGLFRATPQPTQINDIFLSTVHSYCNVPARQRHNNEWTLLLSLSLHHNTAIPPFISHGTHQNQLSIGKVKAPLVSLATTVGFTNKGTTLHLSCPLQQDTVDEPKSCRSRWNEGTVVEGTPTTPLLLLSFFFATFPSFCWRPLFTAAAAAAAAAVSWDNQRERSNNKQRRRRLVEMVDDKQNNNHNSILGI